MLVQVTILPYLQEILRGNKKKTSYDDVKKILTDLTEKEVLKKNFKKIEESDNRKWKVAKKKVGVG